MPGEVYAIACAFLWALSSALLKSQTHKMPVVLLAALRTIPAVSMYWGLLVFSGRINELVHLSLRTWAFLAGSTLVGLVLGDLFYFRSMKLIGLSRALPLSTTYPLFTVTLALLFLDEKLGWAIVGGAALTVAGACLLAFPQGIVRIRRSEATREVELVGVALALGAAICWASSTILLRLGLTGVDVAVANSIRLSVLLVVLVAILPKRGKIGRIRDYGLRSVSIVLVAGIIGTGLGTFAFLAAVQRAGAARASILTATSPLFGVPLSLILKEKLSRRTLLGTMLTMAGVWLTVY